MFKNFIGSMFIPADKAANNVAVVCRLHFRSFVTSGYCPLVESIILS